MKKYLFIGFIALSGCTAIMTPPEETTILPTTSNSFNMSSENNISDVTTADTALKNDIPAQGRTVPVE